MGRGRRLARFGRTKPCDRYGRATVWAHEPARRLVEERTRVTDTFGAGETLPGGAVAHDVQTHDDLHRTLEPLLDLQPEALLLAHGAAIQRDARGALARALAP